MKNIFLISLIFFVSTLKSQDDVYYVVTDTVKHEKVKKLKYPSNYMSSNNIDYFMYHNFYYTSRRYPYQTNIDEIPYIFYYYEDIFYNPTRNNNSFDDVPNKINFKPRTTENKPKIEKTPTNPRTGGRNF